MIDLKSLRIGSVVQAYGLPFSVKSIDGVDETVTLNCPRPNLKFAMEEIEPVRITVELLKELGFEEADCTDYAVKVSLYHDGVRMNAYNRDPAIWTAIVIADCYENAFPDVCYLHELQNICWDLASLLPISSWLTVRPQYRLYAESKCSMTQFTNNHE